MGHKYQATYAHQYDTCMREPFEQLLLWH